MRGSRQRYVRKFGQHRFCLHGDVSEILCPARRFSIALTPGMTASWARQ